jgi:hypothetical protein
MEHDRDQLLIVNHAGPAGLVAALPCLFFGLPALGLVLWGVLQGRLIRDWPTILVALVIGVPMTYFGVGFLTFATCTRLVRSTRGGETWMRLVHRWQVRRFTLPAQSVITIRTPPPGRMVRYRAMLKTTGEAVQLYEHRNRDRVEQQARNAGLFMGVPALLDAQSGQMPLEEDEEVMLEASRD